MSQPNLAHCTNVEVEVGQQLHTTMTGNTVMPVWVSTSLEVPDLLAQGNMRRPKF